MTRQDASHEHILPEKYRALGSPPASEAPLIRRGFCDKLSGVVLLSIP
jgi:hypothetical protein